MLHGTSFWERLNNHLLQNSRDRGSHLHHGSVDNLHQGNELHDLLHCAPLLPLLRSSRLRLVRWRHPPRKRHFLVGAQLEILGACVLLSATFPLMTLAGFCLRGTAGSDGHPLVAKPLTEPLLPPPQCGARIVFALQQHVDL